VRTRTTKTGRLVPSYICLADERGFGSCGDMLQYESAGEEVGALLVDKGNPRE